MIILTVNIKIIITGLVGWYILYSMYLNSDLAHPPTITMWSYPAIPPMLKKADAVRS